MYRFLWFVPLVVAVPGVAACPGVCVDMYVDAGEAPDAVIGLVDDTVGLAVGTVTDSVGLSPEPPASEPAAASPSRAESVAAFVASPPWWAAWGAALMAAAGTAWTSAHAPWRWLLRRAAFLAVIPLAGLFSRIRRDRLLDHPARQAALDILQAEPGLCVRDVAERLDVSWQTMRGHLRRLEAHGHVVGQRTGKRLLYFARGTEAARARQSVAVLRAPTRRRIARSILDAPGVDQATLCRRLGLRNPSASKHLGKLCRAGLVEARPDGRHQRYEATPELMALLPGPPARGSAAATAA